MIDYLHESLPEGVSPAAFRAHPVRQLIRDAAYHGEGGIPSKARLDALELPEAVREQVLKACHEVAAIHGDGFHQQAWRRGDELAGKALTLLPAELRDPGYWEKPDPLAESNDPIKLAAAVGR